MSDPKPVSVARLAAFKGHVTRAIQTCESEVAAFAPSSVNLEFKRDTLIKAFDKYSEAFLLFEEQQDATGDSYDAANKSYQATETTYYDVRSRVQAKIQALNNAQLSGIPNPSSPPTNTKPLVKLRPIELPVFCGNRRDWPAFWENFNTLVHQNKAYENVVKFTYLKQSLQGEAAKQIRGFSGVGTDYAKAIAILTKVYGDERAIRYDIIDKLVSLKAPKCNKEELLDFHTSYTTLLRQLENYVDDVRNGDWATEVMIQRKLPASFCKFLYDRYHENFFTEEQISEGILDFTQRFENSCNLDEVITSQQSSGKSQKSISVPPVTVQNVTIDKMCIFCSSPHSSRHCPQFPTVSARKTKLESMGRCKRCCATNHTSSECKITTFHPCVTCQKTNHHGYLCFQLQPQASNVNATVTSAVKPVKPEGATPSKGNTQRKQSHTDKQSHKAKRDKAKPIVTANQAEEQESSPVTVSTLRTAQCPATSNDRQTLSSTALPTALVTIQATAKDFTHKVRCFFDQGAQLTFITENLQRKLKLTPVSSVSIEVHHGFNNVSSARNFDVVNLIVSLGKHKKRISALVVPALPSAIQTPGLINAADNLRRNYVKLADQYDSDVVTNIDIMIGSNYYSSFIDGLTTRCGIDLLKTSAGYVIYGPVHSNIPVQTKDIQLHHITVADFTIFSEEPPVHKLWDLDTIGIDISAPVPQDDAVYQNFLNTVEYTDRYYTRLPWKKDHPPLPNNYKMAVGQLHALHKSLSTKPEMLNHYHSIIQDQLEQGFIEEVQNPKVHSASHYIPHHAVSKDSPTTPLRIVYNCSAKASKGVPSLNDCLMKGPSITEKLGDILLAFRTNEYAFTADISKAFLRIGLQESDRDFTRFLWLEDPHDPRSRIITYRFASVLFGATSSPFLLQATLDFHLRKSSSPYKKLIREHFYVDNLVGAMGSESQLQEYYHDANQELKSANMPLREWASNSKKLQLQIQKDQNGTQNDSVNLLGLQWNTYDDTLQLHPVHYDTNVDVQVTKRNLLSNISRIFDPLGFLSPVTVRGKILLQQAWRLRVGWDVTLPSELSKGWKVLSQDLLQLSFIKIPRKTCSQDSNVNLVIFCDASTSAFGVVAYAVSEQGSHLLMSKTRVAPLQSRTLPQLELTALQLGAQLAHTLSSTLKHIPFRKITLFCDNEAALQWVRNDQSTISYVKNRVHKIRELTSNVQILHVPSGENPADLLTRGISYKKFHTKKFEFWFKGPSWMMDETKWPTQKQYVVVQELRVDALRQTEPVIVRPSPIDINRFSTYDALIKTTEFVYKYLKWSSSPEEYWIKYIQRTEYPKVYQYLVSNDAEQCSVRVSSLQTPIRKFIKDLGLYIDDSGIIRSRSRLHNSLYHVKDQILLPPESKVTALIILKVHRSVKHGGMSETLTQLRLQYWIPKGRLTVKRVLKTCVHCKRIFAVKISYPGPPPLPQERVRFVRPFEATGVDYTGAILIRDGSTKELVKVYICLFTCASSRAVHLELARDMSAATFISLFRRFCARFSTPRVVISDNGTSFTASAKYLKSLFEDPAIKDHFHDQKITWKFIPPRSPWHGGFYERMVGIVKGCLQKSLFKRILNWDELVTVLMEVEQCVNNRPLTYVTSELPDLVALTPNHLLKGEVTRIMPPITTTDSLDPLYLDYDALQLNLHYSKLSEVLQKFAQIWAKDYLAALKEKHFGNVPPHQAVSVKPGDIVLLSSDHPRNRWPLGRITKVFPDSDNIVRTVEVFSQGHTSVRTLDKLHALELASEPEIHELSQDAEIQGEANVEVMRPRRRAAQRCDDDRKLLLDADQL